MAPILRVRKRDGTILEDISSIAFDKSAKRRLNRPSECTFRVPSYLVSEIQDDGKPLICAGYRNIELSLDSTGLFHHGIAWIVEDEGDADMCYTRVTSYDPMVVWRYRPARDGFESPRHTIGDFSDPQFIQRQRYGPQIMQEILEQSEKVWTYGADDAEGQLFLDLANSTYAAPPAADLRGAPTDFPMSIAEIASMLTNTGELDIVITPIIGGVGSTIDVPGSGNWEQFMNLGTVHCYHGNYGQNRTGTTQVVRGVTYVSVSDVHFDYQTGDFNVQNIRRSDDMTTICTKLWDYLGSREDLQHWHANVTGDSTQLTYPPGGKVVDTSNQHPILADNGLGDLIFASREALGVFMLIGVYDNFGSEESAYPLYARLWQIESLLRGKPREMVYITPTRTSPLETTPGDVFLPGDFDIGDLVMVNTGPKSRITESGMMRIYGYTIDIDDDGVEALGEFEASPDQDSI
jgi:hypothetical protein